MVHPAHRAGIAKINSLAEEINVPFRIIQNHKDALDPEVIYFLPAEADPPFNQGQFPDLKSGFLFFKWAYRNITWDAHDKDQVVSVAAVRKWIQDPHTLGECIICMENVQINEHMSCPECHSFLCTLCFLKHHLTHQAIATICARDRAAVICVRHFPNKCPQCRVKFRCDLRDSYYQVFDPLDVFSPVQRRCLEFLRDHDPDFTAIRQGWLRARAFKVGDLVVLHNLNKEEWNGKVAVIIGKRTNKNGVRRWPIQLKDTSQAKVSIKENNMKKVNVPGNRFVRLCD